jgi:hypothetical protein
MPAMPSMPKQNPKTHAEGVPGDYGVVAYFPHGGDYQIDLVITPPSEKAFTASFKVMVKDAIDPKKRKPKPKPFLLEIKSGAPARSGQPTDLKIVIRRREDKKPVTDFETVHEQKMHFIIVSKDLQFFSHEHPEPGDDGTFRLRFTFPHGGDYCLFADTAPRGAGSQVLMQPFQVAGSPPFAPGVLKPSPAPQDTVGGVKIVMTTDARKLPVGRSMDLAFSLTDEKTGADITDIQPWLGAVAHLILIHEDGATFVHSHPDESNPTNGKGAVTFLARFPKSGLYKGWLQFQRGGKVETASFVVQAREVE